MDAVIGFLPCDFGPRYGGGLHCDGLALASMRLCSRWEITVDRKPRTYSHSMQLAIDCGISQAQKPSS
jgi:hypothetical protein